MRVCTVSTVGHCNQDLFGDGMDGAGRQNRVWAGLDATAKRPHLPSTSVVDTMSMLLSLGPSPRFLCLGGLACSFSSSHVFILILYLFV